MIDRQQHRECNSNLTAKNINKKEISKKKRLRLKKDRERRVREKEFTSFGREKELSFRGTGEDVFQG